MAVTASGSASVTHRTTTIARMPAIVCAGLVKGSGSSGRASRSAGPSTRPTARRLALNSSSAGNRFRRPRARYGTCAPAECPAVHTPSITTLAHPVRETPASDHSTVWLPPGRDHGEPATAPPCAMAATADAAGARPRRRGGADAALPDQDADAVRRLDGGELDVGALGKHRVRGQRRPEPVEAWPVRQRSEDHALRVAHPQHRCRDRLAGHVDGLLAEVGRAGPSAAGTRRTSRQP